MLLPSIEIPYQPLSQTELAIMSTLEDRHSLPTKDDVTINGIITGSLRYTKHQRCQYTC